MVSLDAASVVPDPTTRGTKNSLAHDAPSRGAAHGGRQVDEVQDGQGVYSDPGDLGHLIQGDPRLLRPWRRCGEGEEEQNPPHKRKMAASEDAEASVRPKGSKRPRRTSARAVGKSSERVELSDESGDDPSLWGGKNWHPKGTSSLL